MKPLITVHPGMNLSLAISAAAAENGWPLVLDNDGGKIVIGTPDDPAPVVTPAAPDAPKPAAPRAPKGKPGRQPRHTDDDVVEVVRANAPIDSTGLQRLLGVASKGSLNIRLRRLADAGHIEKVGATWRIPTAASRHEEPTDAPQAPGGGIDPGPMPRRAFDPDAARSRAAGSIL